MAEQRSPDGATERRRKVSIQVNVNPFFDATDGVSGHPHQPPVLESEADQHQEAPALSESFESDNEYPVSESDDNRTQHEDPESDGTLHQKDHQVTELEDIEHSHHESNGYREAQGQYPHDRQVTDSEENQYMYSHDPQILESEDNEHTHESQELEPESNLHQPQPQTLHLDITRSLNEPQVLESEDEKAAQERSEQDDGTAINDIPVKKPLTVSDSNGFETLPASGTDITDELPEFLDEKQLEEFTFTPIPFDAVTEQHRFNGDRKVQRLSDVSDSGYDESLEVSVGYVENAANSSNNQQTRTLEENKQYHDCVNGDDINLRNDMTDSYEARNGNGKENQHMDTSSHDLTPTRAVPKRPPSPVPGLNGHYIPSPSARRKHRPPSPVPAVQAHQYALPRANNDSPSMKRKTSPAPVFQDQQFALPRAKSTSPSMKRKASPSTAHIPRRKISSDARFGPRIDALEYELTPRRKISSEARLGVHHRVPGPVSAGTAHDAINSRRRRVSFGSRAYIFGQTHAPLNDETHTEEQVLPLSPAEASARLIESQIAEIQPDSHQEVGSVYDARQMSSFLPENQTAEKSVGDAVEHTSSGVPTFTLNGAAADRASFSADNGPDSGQLHVSTVPDENGYAYENEAFESDEKWHNISLESTDLGQPSADTATDSSFRVENEDRRTDVSPRTPRKLIVYNMEDPRKVSTQSLPVGMDTSRNGFLPKMTSSQSLEEGMPRSILKRKEDAESMRSEDSFYSDRKTSGFSVRKDSIALFSDKHGELLEARKQFLPPWKRYDRNDIKRLWNSRGEMLEKYKLHLLVLFMFTITVAFVIVGLHFHSIHKKTQAISRKVFFDGKLRTLTLSDAVDRDEFVGKLGQNIPEWKLPSHCYKNYEKIHDKTCLKWKGHAILDIVFTSENRTQCYNVSWRMLSEERPLDCFHLGAGPWFGPANVSAAPWPIGDAEFTFNTASVKHYDTGTFGSALDYYWLSSTGAAIVVDSSFPLEVNWNKRRKWQVCISTSTDHQFYSHGNAHPRTFHYTVCNGISMVATHSYVQRKFFPVTDSFPEHDVLAKPHWSSLEGNQNDKTTETMVTDIANKIRAHKLPCSTIEIDGQWERKFGDLRFNSDSFTNMTLMLEELSSVDCSPSLSVYPYFDFNSTNFREGLTGKYFMKAPDNKVPALLQWQHGIGAMLDVSNPLARAWLTRKVMKLAAAYNIQHFRFTYGTSSWIPNQPLFHMEDMSPNTVKRLFTELMSSFDGSVIHHGTSGSQHITNLMSIVTRPTKVSDEVSCISQLIPKALSLGMLGYPFLISDGFDIDHVSRGAGTGDSSLPSRELFLRWMQVSAFFPAMRYTVKPWAYDDELVEVSRNLTTLHREIVLPLMYSLHGQVKDGFPILRPIWWLREDTEAFHIADEFLVGNDLLVAPMLCEGMTERDIYFPSGVWKDLTKDTIILGPRWLKDYKVSKYDIPYFHRQRIHGEA